MKHGEDGVMEEHFIRKKNIVEEKSLVYLGHVLSKTGGNLENIYDKRNKSLQTQKQIKTMVESLYLFLCL